MDFSTFKYLGTSPGGGGRGEPRDDYAFVSLGICFSSCGLKTFGALLKGHRVPLERSSTSGYSRTLFFPVPTKQLRLHLTVC